MQPCMCVCANVRQQFEKCSKKSGKKNSFIGFVNKNKVKIYCELKCCQDIDNAYVAVAAWLPRPPLFNQL